MSLDLEQNSKSFVPVTEDTFGSITPQPTSVEPYLCTTLKPIRDVGPLKFHEYAKAGRYSTSAVSIKNVEQASFPTHLPFSSLFLAALQDAVITENFLVISNRGELIEEGLTPFPISQDNPNDIPSIYTEIMRLNEDTAFLQVRGKVRRIEEPCVLISGGPDGAGSYYHWMIDYLPRIALAEKDPSLQGLKFVVNQDLSSFQLDTLKILGIDQDRLIGKERTEWLVCDTLHIPSYLSKTANAHPRAIAFLREKFLPHVLDRDDKGPRRVYLSRSDSPNRRLVNEADVENFLRDHQFDIIVPGTLSPIEQIWAVSNAEVIVAPHGAALTNLAFAPLDAKIIELITKPHLSGLSITGCLQQPYRSLFPVIVNPGKLEFQQSLSDLKIALSEVLPV